jgi:hypothetical protein
MRPYVFDPVLGVQVEQVDVILGFVVGLVVLIALDLVKV